MVCIKLLVVYVLYELNFFFFGFPVCAVGSVVLGPVGCEYGSNFGQCSLSVPVDRGF